MTLIDTNVLVYASLPESRYHEWAKDFLVDAGAEGRSAVNPIILAEFDVGAAVPSVTLAFLERWAVELVDLPIGVAQPAAECYRQYRANRIALGLSPRSEHPLPDFFIGAHAQLMGWSIATADQGIFPRYFPELRLLSPEPSSPELP